MTEQDYIFIRKLELESYSVLQRMSDIELIKNPNEIAMLHRDIEIILEKIQNSINTRQIKSQKAYEFLEQMKKGFIEMLITTEELVIDRPYIM